jgi:hypothetical protein
VLIKGSGFNHPAASMNVLFGQEVLTGVGIQVIDEKTIKIVAPSASFGGPIDVFVTKTKGKSTAAVFKLVGSIPIDWTTGSFFSYARPTVGKVGIDKKFYVATHYGRIMTMTMNDDFTQVLISLIIKVDEGDEVSELKMVLSMVERVHVQIHPFVLSSLVWELPLIQWIPNQILMFTLLPTISFTRGH